MTNKEKLPMIECILTKFEALNNYFTEDERQFIRNEYGWQLESLATTYSDAYGNIYNHLCQDFRKITTELRKEGIAIK